MRPTVKLLLACLAGGALSSALASGSGTMPAPSIPRAASPEQQARELYNDGVGYVRKADKVAFEAAQATDARKKDRALHESVDRYTAALGKFAQTLRLDPQRYEAWNYVGYTSRKLGHYDDALAAYDKALSLKPGYPEAIEYRGEAYLAVNRLADAKQAYLDLFAGNRALAGKLLAAMKTWAATQREAPAGADAASIDELDKWIEERAQIASQTAALTRTGAAASWR